MGMSHLKIRSGKLVGCLFSMLQFTTNHFTIMAE